MNFWTKKVRYWSACALGVLGPASAWAAVVEPFIGVEGRQYAVETQPSSRVDLDFGARSDEGVSLNGPSGLPYRTLHVFSFIEPGKNGDYSFDIDDSAFRFQVTEAGHAWFGRVHPLAEAWPSARPKNTDAIGALWVQNQSDALSPRVSGWIGGGLEMRNTETGWGGVVSYSPIFLPTFGPRLSLSGDDAASGSRFSRLPPAYVNVNGAIFPMRYNVDLSGDDTRQIVLQNQFFAAVGKETRDYSVQLMAWSAPQPDPSVDVTGAIQVTQTNDVNVLAQAKPSFPRKNVVAARAGLPSALLTPVFETAYDLTENRMTVSTELGTAMALKPFTIRGGALHTLGDPTSSVSSDSGSVFTPTYARYLFWTQADVSLMRELLVPSLRIEQHLVPGGHGQWIRPGVNYQATREIGVFATANIINGEDLSYFGTWRSLDSVAVGGNIRW